MKDAKASDTARFDLIPLLLPSSGIPDYQLVLLLRVAIDSSEIRAASASFAWSNPYFTLDSAVLPSDVQSAFNSYLSAYRSNSRDSSNAYDQISFNAVSAQPLGSSLMSNGNPVELARYYFTASQWSIADSAVFDTISVGPVQSLDLVIRPDSVSFTPPVRWNGSMRIRDAAVDCCVARRGNVDGDIYDFVNFPDFTKMIDYLFLGGPPARCPDEANLDLSADGLMSLVDLSIMIDHLFINQNPLPSCQ